MVTWAGWLFHYSDGTPLPLDTDPAFQGTIEFRPNESAEQFIPDRLPVDDSQLFAPPPLELTPNVTPAGEGEAAAAAAAAGPVAPARPGADGQLHAHPARPGLAARQARRRGRSPAPRGSVFAPAAAA